MQYKIWILVLGTCSFILGVCEDGFNLDSAIKRKQWNSTCLLASLSLLALIWASYFAQSISKALGTFLLTCIEKSYSLRGEEELGIEEPCWKNEMQVADKYLLNQHLCFTRHRACFFNLSRSYSRQRSFPILIN
jgi:hypothetical protein